MTTAWNPAWDKPISSNAIDVWLGMGSAVDTICRYLVSHPEVEVRLKAGRIEVNNGALVAGTWGIEPTSYDWSWVAANIGDAR